MRCFSIASHVKVLDRGPVGWEMPHCWVSTYRQSRISSGWVVHTRSRPVGLLVVRLRSDWQFVASPRSNRPRWLCRSSRRTHLSNFEIGFSVEIRRLNVAYRMRFTEKNRRKNNADWRKLIGTNPDESRTRSAGKNSLSNTLTMSPTFTFRQVVYSQFPCR